MRTRSKKTLHQLLVLLSKEYPFSEEEKGLLESFIKQTQQCDNFNENSKIFQRIKKLCVPAQKSLKVTEKSIKDFFKNVIEREIKNGYPEPKIDSEIWGTVYENVTLHAEKEFFYHLYRFLRHSLPHKDLLQEAETQKIKEKYSFLNVLSMGRQVILEGLADSIAATAIYFHFKESPVYSDDALGFLWIKRSQEGTLEIKVKLYNASKKRPAMHQVCFK